MSSPGGSFDQHVKGEWAIDGDRLLFKYNDAVVPYAYKLEGKELKLTLTGSLKKETILVKQ